MSRSTPGLQQRHGEGVAKNMGRHDFAANPGFACRGYRPPDDVRHTEPGHSLTLRTAEYRTPIMHGRGHVRHQGSEGLSEIGGTGTTRSLRPLPRRSTWGLVGRAGHRRH